MFAGHVGAGLALGAIERHRNGGMLVLAALLCDAMLWLLVLAGVERVIVPPDYGARHYLLFDFPYSHELLACAAWAAAFGLAAAALCAGQRRLRFWALAAAAVLSHFVLDVLVHPPELPLAGDASTRIGSACGTGCRSHSRSKPRSPSWASHCTCGRERRAARARSPSPF